MVRQRKRKFKPPTEHLFEKGLACTHVDTCAKCAMGFHVLHGQVEELKARLAALGHPGDSNGRA